MLPEQLFGATIKFDAVVSNSVVSVYAVKTNSGKFLFDAVVNNLTQEIKVCWPDTTEVELGVKAKMKMVGEKETFPPQPVYRPSSDYVKSIIYPRIIGLLADKLVD
jgi:hypothetical protein